MEIKKKLKDARANAGLTQEQVAEKIMVSRQTISNWENGKSLPDIISIINLSDLYQISLDELLKGDTKMKEKIEETRYLVWGPNSSRPVDALPLQVNVRRSERNHPRRRRDGYYVEGVKPARQT